MSSSLSQKRQPLPTHTTSAGETSLQQAISEKGCNSTADNRVEKAAHHLFKGRKLVIATKHKKEEVIAPLLEEALGVACVVVAHLDTDVLGTFSGEVERCSDAVTTARVKCQLAMELTGCDLAVSSEGSFGPHPDYWFVSADEELLLLVDKKNLLEIGAREISLSTNFCGEEIQSELQLSAFAEKALFPSHALILRKDKATTAGMIKGITDWGSLALSFHELREKWGCVFVETDMRALYNPSRMAVIEQATLSLLDKVNTCCPHCSAPGYAVTHVKQGLPCGLCGHPTSAALSLVSTCPKCAFTSEKYYPANRMSEDPACCFNCNP